MKRTAKFAGLTLAVLAAAALPLDSAMAGKKGHHDHDDGHGYSYGPPRYGHGKHHHHHHYRPPVVVVAPPRYPHHHHHHDYWGGSKLGFVYDSFSDSFRVGGSYYFR